LFVLTLEREHMVHTDREDGWTQGLVCMFSGKKFFFCPCWESNTRSSSPWPSHCTFYSILAHTIT
jgi:hypothetical protein